MKYPSVVLPAMKYPMCRITYKAIPSLTCNSKINLSCRITCNTILNVSYLSPTVALQWFRMFICFFFVEMFIQDYAWLRCWQGYTVHERWLGLVEGVDLENVLFSVLKLSDNACGSPCPSPDDGGMSLGLWLSLDTGRLLMTGECLLACGSPWTQPVS